MLCNFQKQKASNLFFKSLAFSAVLGVGLPPILSRKIKHYQLPANKQIITTCLFNKIS